MPDLTCPTCARPVPEAEIQRGARKVLAPHPVAMVMALGILRSAAEAGVLPRTAFGDLHRLELALRAVLA